MNHIHHEDYQRLGSGLLIKTNLKYFMVFLDGKEWR